MPIFEFQCTKCRHLFEEFFAKLPERPSAKCPECGGKGKKLISNVGIVFKGAGFYVTDSRTSPAKGSSSSSSTTSKPATAPSPDSSDSGGSDTSSSDTSSESKSEPKSDTSSEKKKKSKSSDSSPSDS